MNDVAENLPEIEAKVMSGLKDFQKATVERIDELFRNGQMRVLVSDEVGLGKTLVARGAIAKLAMMRKEQNDDLVKIAYICSNGAIADQNLHKLKINRDVRTESVSGSRLSMQHLNIFFQENDPNLKKSYIQLIPLTPETSFRCTSGYGASGERALIFALLKRQPEFEQHERALDLALQGNASTGWAGEKSWYERRAQACDTVSQGRYFREMQAAISWELKTEIKQNESGFTLQKLLQDTCTNIEKSGFQRMNTSYLVGQLRLAFARISLERLNPDLVIMDEFQRFKFLITADPKSETGMLTSKFFHTESVRMLLLSATPYKMYSTLEEIDTTQVDEHYVEFLQVMKFLNVSDADDDAFKKIWSDYSVQLREFSQGTVTVISARKAAEDAMYNRMLRTERISAHESADIIDDTDVRIPVRVLEQDILSYIDAQKLLDTIGASYNVPIDYIKSTPYLMSFMRDYQLKRNVESYFQKHPDQIDRADIRSLWLDRQTLNKYREIPSNNARLEHVTEKVFEGNPEMLLWVPPSRPYYEFAGVFRNQEHFTKTLIFSSWEMVPRMAACMISYRAEVRTAGKLARLNHARNAQYLANDQKRYPPARLEFSASKLGKPNNMSLFCLLYPSVFLADCYDPIDCLNNRLSLKEIEKRVREAISAKLDRYRTTDRGDPDYSWYYMAPLLLDGPGDVTAWLNCCEEVYFPDEEEEGTAKGHRAFSIHVKELRQLYAKQNNGLNITLGKKPDDLLDVLTDMAIASPAVCVYRTYRKYVGNHEAFESYYPSQIAKLFMNRMNTVESTAAVELAIGKKSNDKHWRDVLTYGKHGNLQAMFDEYAHLITNGIDDTADVVYNLHRTIAESMSFRTTPYAIDTFEDFRKRMCGEKDNRPRIRSHFAVAFTKGDGKERDANRKRSVRNAFNSPFRPFVLASTSIGQEGLDFHNYCRRIVHWNLPANPIDLEQREGRINRFECLAIRQTVAHRYGNDLTFRKDVWKELFEAASQHEKTEGCSDLIPFWGLKDTGSELYRIERIVPMYPFSRDGLAYERLIKILSLYRLTLGQARQEELVEYLIRNCPDKEKMKDMFINLSPFYREKEKR